MEKPGNFRWSAGSASDLLRRRTHDIPAGRERRVELPGTMSQPQLGLSRQSLTARLAASGVGALAVLSIAHIVIDGYSSAYAPILTILRERLGLTYAQVGGGAAVFTFSASIMQPVYGLLADRWRTTALIILSPGIAALGLGAISLTGPYPAVLACLFAAGIGVAAFHPQGATQAVDCLPKRPNLSMALFVGAGNLGFAIGPIAISVLYATWGFGGLWRLAIPGLLVSFFLIRAAPQPAPHPPRVRGGTRSALLAQWKPLLTLYLFIVVRGTVMLIYVSFLTLYLIESGVAEARSLTILSIFLASGSSGGMVGGLLGDRLGERTVIRASMVLALPLFLGVFYVPSLTARIVVLCGAVLFLLLSNPVTIVLAQSWVPHHRSTVSSLLMGFAWGVGGIVAPLFGRAADLFGLETALFWLGTLPLLGIILAWMLPERGAPSEAT